MAHISHERHEDCGCRTCSTCATITEYDCGCVDVDIHYDRQPCDQCTDFSGKSRHCGQAGHPSDHD